MHKAFGGLLTWLGSRGVEHARNELLDRRVINEVGEGKSLKRPEGNLNFFKSLWGRKLLRQGVNVGLDDLHESDLAGSLTRALMISSIPSRNCLHPYEPAIKQELFHKIQTLTADLTSKAGQSLEQIESELTETIERSVEEVNRILEQIHVQRISKFADSSCLIREKPSPTEMNDKLCWNASLGMSTSPPRRKLTKKTTPQAS